MCCQNGLVFHTHTKILRHGSHLVEKSLDEGLISEKKINIVKSAVFEVGKALGNVSQFAKFLDKSMGFRTRVAHPVQK